MADQHIRGKADQLPKNEEHHEIVRENNAEHREHEERERGEIAGLALVFPHVSQRINMDERPDARNENEHRLAEIIQHEPKRHFENAAYLDPRRRWR